MGRRKIKIMRLENTSARQITYSKRKAGLAKKAMELSVLCDINVALVMFSPAGKPTSYIGGNNYWTNPEEVETFPEIVAMEECLVESLNRLHKRKTQNSPWPPAQYFPRLNGRTQAEQNLALTMRDFGGHGNARGAAENVNMPFFNHAQLLSSVGPSYEVPPENLI
ncbi:MADS-box protein AGL65 [Cinnamomum micranthum f. kanehirae]|uniref:MADS-box protein AGL65 n=1 Tax=Cinnamomum micranthum f. kanehirae TaxID=337451 RepID=A0A3S3N4Q2_9MAGN|nr:MADS-box protein AGL65 [Cinnamomum micranthum f. kanehirae]